MENLKQALQVLITTSMTVDKAMEDKNITPLEWAQIAIKSIGFWRVVKNIEPIRIELESLSTQGRTDLTLWAEKEFDLQNDNLEQTIEKLFQVIIEIASVILALKTVPSVSTR
jgi:hypothetical protein